MCLRMTEENMKILDAMFPRYCVHCDREGALLCARCVADLSFDGPPFAYANPVIRQLICAWKYDGDIEGLRTLVTLLRPRLEPLKLHLNSLKVEGIVPVPLSAWKERWRGFHQARDLARVIGEELKIPVVDALEREHRWTAQANLSKEVRRTKEGKMGKTGICAWSDGSLMMLHHWRDDDCGRGALGAEVVVVELGRMKTLHHGARRTERVRSVEGPHSFEKANLRG